MRYYKFSRYLKEQFGCRVYKVGIDAGFSCPNKDGKLSKDGCIYCDNRAFSFNSRLPVPKPIERQIQEGINFGKSRYRAKKFIIYFQAHTNTYACVDILKEKYDIVRKFKDIVGVSIGTRPDCVSDDILDLIKTYTLDYNVWLEYGLGSIHKKTLEFINRNHTCSDFLKATEKAKKRNIKVCAHIIIGLPKETKNEILETAKELGRIEIDGVKIHPLHIIKGTTLEKLYRESLYNPLELNEFVELTCDFLGFLSPNSVVQRVGADCPRELLVEPKWVLEKEAVLGLLEKKLSERDAFQGKFYKGDACPNKSGAVVRHAHHPSNPSAGSGFDPEPIEGRAHRGTNHPERSRGSARTISQASVNLWKENLIKSR